ncbi:MAG: hypothetical protein LWX70_16400 [Sphingobacteriia bacterium]|nr:hypothetical protein [Sphingobacteriia bacterium]
MADKSTDLRNAIQKKIDHSAGFKFLNQTHARSFSYNIFKMNALEAQEAIDKVSHPDCGLQLMSQDNQEEGQQAHRELSRLLHNFVAASKTLVDHTRVFIKEKYENTCISSEYQNQINQTFVNSPVSKFVHDLRNYMLHKGLPNSHMYIEFTQDPTKPENGDELKSGFRLDTKSLLKWENWHQLAKEYIKDAGEYIDLNEVITDYCALVERFYLWLDDRLNKYHQNDITELNNLKMQAMLKNNIDFEIPSKQVENEEKVEYLQFSKSVSAEIDQLCIEIASKIRRIHFANKGVSGFPSHRPTQIINKDQVIGTPIFTGQDIDGVSVMTFFNIDDQPYGISLEDFELIHIIRSKIFSFGWAKQVISDKFITDKLIEWFKENYHNNSLISFSEKVLLACEKHIHTWKIIVPIANLEVEKTLKLGDIQIIPITSNTIDDIKFFVESIAPNKNKEQANILISKIRDEMQGLSAITMTVKAECGLAHDIALNIAQDVVDLLRFLTPTAKHYGTSSQISLLGSENTPYSKVLMTSKTHFSFSEKCQFDNIGYWRISKKYLSSLKKNGLNELSELIHLEDLSPFQEKVRNSIIQYSKSLLMINQIDRLNCIILALENVLLHHAMEPKEFTISNRMANLLALANAEKEEVAENVKRAYRINDRHKVLPLSQSEEGTLTHFILYAYEALKIVLLNSENFNTADDFIYAINYSQ